MKSIFTLLLPVFGMLYACSYSEGQMSQFDQRIEKFTAGKSFHLTKSESGLYTEIIEAGTGREIHLTDSIGVSYVGTLLSGKKFDEQKNTIYLPMRGVIDAWKEALIGQKKGVKLRIIAPPQLGYGAGGMDKIPPNASLYFELRVDDVK
jgi:FKBP-type peptidyl-prolyl cis-trans isomerase FkpA